MTFGYGISLLIPFLLFFRLMHLTFGLGSFLGLVISFVFLMIVLAKISSFKPVLNVWILLVHGLIGYLKFMTGYSLLSAFLLALAVFVFLVTLKDVEILGPVYRRWMKVAHFVGNVISSLVLALMFYLVFAPVGIVLRLIGKDLLNRTIEKEKDSYWIRKEKEAFDPKRYQQQF